MIYVNSSGWGLAKRVYVNSAGSWIEPSRIWVNNSGTWRMVHATATISANVNNPNLGSLFGSPATPITAVLTINGNVIVGSNSTSLAALDTSTLPSGSILYLIMQGGAYIVGAGGNGGPGGGGSGSNGLNGGTAINLTCTMYLNSAGTIGGGGGGGAGAATWPGHAPQCGGGGGGAGAIPGNGGSGYAGGAPGTSGSLTTGGIWVPQFHCGGGNGGNLGSPGSNSGNCDAQPGASGGSPGKAINLNGNPIGYINAGTILGAVS